MPRPGRTSPLRWAAGLASLPVGLLGRGPDDRGVARACQVLQPECNRVLARGGRDFVDELLAREWIWGPTGSRR